MLQVLVDADPRLEFEKVYELAKSEGVDAEVLRQLPININAKNSVEKTVVNVLFEEGQEKGMKKLLEAGAEDKKGDALRSLCRGVCRLFS